MAIREHQVRAQDSLDILVGENGLIALEQRHLQAVVILSNDSRVAVPRHRGRHSLCCATRELD
jgi:hypothetical protein